MNVDAYLAGLTDRLLARLDATGDATSRELAVTSVVGHYLGALEALAESGDLPRDEVGPRFRAFTDVLPDVATTRTVTAATSTSGGATVAAAGSAGTHGTEATGPSVFRGLVEVGDRIVDTDDAVVTLVAVELWSDTVLVRWAVQTSSDDGLDVLLDPERTVAERRDAAVRRRRALERRSTTDDWSLQDDLGTAYVLSGGGSIGGGRGPSRGESRFRPSVPDAARHLVIVHREGHDDRVRVPVDLPDRD